MNKRVQTSSIGEVMRTIRHEKDYTQEFASELCDIDVKTLQNIENSYSNPKIETILKFSKSFNFRIILVREEDFLCVKEQIDSCRFTIYCIDWEQ